MVNAMNTYTATMRFHPIMAGVPQTFTLHPKGNFL